MNALDRLRTRLAPAVTITCVENTYIPKRNGASNVLAKVGKSTASTTDNFHLVLPTRVRDVEWIDEDTARWPIASRPGHFVTYRISV